MPPGVTAHGDEKARTNKYPWSISLGEQLPRTDTGELYKQELVTKYS